MAKREREKRKTKYDYADTREVMDKEHARSGLSYLNLPKGASMFVVKEAGIRKFDILPYKTKTNPAVPAGKFYYTRTFFIHKNVGPANESYCCLRQFNEPCPICQHANNMGPEEGKEAQQSLRAKKRQVYAIFDRKDPEKGMQIYETPFYLMFGEALKNKLDSGKDEDDPESPGMYDGFWHVDGGKTLKVQYTTTQGDGYTFQKPTNIEFIDRADEIPEEVLESVPCLDDLLVRMTHDQLKKKFYGESDGKKAAGKKGKDEDEDEEEAAEDEEEEETEEEEDDDKTADELGIETGSTVKYKGKECEVVKVSKDGTSLTLKSGKGTLFKAVAPNAVELLDSGEDEEEEDDEDATVDEEEDDEESEEEEEASDDDDDDWGDDDAEEEDEEEKPAKAKKKTKK